MSIATATENPFEVVLSNGDRAEAESVEGIVLAAQTLCRDAREAAGVVGPKPTATFLFEGKCIRADVPSSQIFAGRVV